MLTFVAQPHHSFRLGDFLCDGLCNPKWTHFRAAIAFVKNSGAQYISADLAQFVTKGKATISVGISHGGSSVEGLMNLISSVGTKGTIWVYKNPSNTFHPKLYLFKCAGSAEILIGSGNLTKGGLFQNAEAGVKISLDLAIQADLDFLKSVEETLDMWSVSTPGLCMPLDATLVKLLQSTGELPTEAEIAAATNIAAVSIKAGKSLKPSPFKSHPIPTAPSLPAKKSKPSPSAPNVAPPVLPSKGAITLVPSKTFGMTLQNTDVGFGQTTAGAQARSPEIFIPLAALDLAPGLWGWKDKFKPDLSKYKPDLNWRKEHETWMAAEAAKTHRKPRPLDKLDWVTVLVKLAGVATPLVAAIGFNPIKKDIRIRESHLRSAGNVDDIILIRSAPLGSTYDFDIEIIPKAHPKYSSVLSKLTHKIPNSLKRIGFF